MVAKSDNIKQNERERIYSDPICVAAQNDVLQRTQILKEFETIIKPKFSIF